MDDRKIFGAISNQELLGEVERRVQSEGLTLPESFVGSVVAAAEIDGAALEEIVFKNKVESFINPDSEMDMGIKEQLEFMDEFWQRLDMAPPELSDDQKAKIADTLEKNPNNRLLPTPLLDLEGRKDIADRARSTFPSQKFTSSGSALSVPDESNIYGQLLKNPDGRVKDGDDNYGLGFKLPDGEQIIGRTNFVNAMVENGQAIEDENGIVWIYPVMDVRVSSPRSLDNARKLYEQVDPTGTSDSNLSVQLLHQAAGKPFIGFNVDFANEAVFKLDDDGKPKALVDVVSMYWSGYQQVQLGIWRGNNRYGNFGVRAAKSGI
ncbi:MAG TPA: hypothetical protein VFK11_03540 [Candidatus Saccharimonadales bacterium]|nr:hypothetical protein [Candidatus Saccharimonadales bacterium]